MRLKSIASMKTSGRCAVVWAFTLFAVAGAWAAPPADDFKALMRKTLDAWETLDPANAAPFYDPNPDNVYFDTTPLKYAGFSAYAEGVKNNFPDLASVKFTLGDDVRIHPQGNLTWATATLHFDLTTKGGTAMPLDCRWTVVWEKRGAKWLIVHEHVSAPLSVPPSTAGLPLYKRLGGYDSLAADRADRRLRAQVRKDHRHRDRGLRGRRVEDVRPQANERVATRARIVLG